MVKLKFLQWSIDVCFLFFKLGHSVLFKTNLYNLPGWEIKNGILNSEISSLKL